MSKDNRFACIIPSVAFLFGSFIPRHGAFFVGQVADFGLSREEMLTRNGANIRGTYGYLDPEYVSSRSFTKKSDVYSFGIILFELITAINPQQGLMEYIDLVSDFRHSYSIF